MGSLGVVSRFEDVGEFLGVGGLFVEFPRLRDDGLTAGSYLRCLGVSELLGVADNDIESVAEIVTQHPVEDDRLLATFLAGGHVPGVEYVAGDRRVGTVAECGFEPRPRAVGSTEPKLVGALRATADDLEHLDGLSEGRLVVGMNVVENRLVVDCFMA